jgi:hypothetical protein
MKIQHCLAVAIIALFSMVSGYASASNIALGKAVSLYDPLQEYGNSGSWAPGVLDAPGSITDGVYLPAGSVWDDYTVYWTAPSTAASQLTLTVDLGGLYSLTGITLQADNNDLYSISYLDAADSWHGLGAIAPNTDASWGVGLGYLTGLTDVVAKKLAIAALAGDLNYSVSQIAAEGSLVPLPAALPLFGAGLIGLAGLGARKRSARK